MPTRLRLVGVKDRSRPGRLDRHDDVVHETDHPRPPRQCHLVLRFRLDSPVRQRRDGPLDDLDGACRSNRAE